MEARPACLARVMELAKQGVSIPNPLTVEIGAEVDLGRISGRGVTLLPGCRIAGDKTVISSGVTLGKEAPVTLEDCQLGPGVELKGGYFSKSTFLAKANLALGAHVREGCLLEEEANGAHCVGIKQTILFPFVTLGSLINFCDCLMAGGTSRKDHSEVGSSYIHFNFTPNGDKSTPSLFGDVPRGVMLNQPAIFLGGQGGAVGPIRIGYGCVTAAGSIIRDDVPEDRKLIIPSVPGGGVKPYLPHAYKNLPRLLANNLIYMANLVALGVWYREVRQPFFAQQELGLLVYAGALDKLASAMKERVQRLKALVAKVADTHPLCACKRGAGCELHNNLDAVCALFTGEVADDAIASQREGFLTGYGAGPATGNDYVKTIQGLSAPVAAAGVRWLQQIVDTLCTRAVSLWPFVTISRSQPAQAGKVE
jgi:bifunctional UDP-N-acetylglucosamine pyrophosphorylase/glucosamine-1-phosphate N-acetyltransferase